MPCKVQACTIRCLLILSTPTYALQYWSLHYTVTPHTTHEFGPALLFRSTEFKPCGHWPASGSSQGINLLFQKFSLLVWNAIGCGPNPKAWLPIINLSRMFFSTLSSVYLGARAVCRSGSEILSCVSTARAIQPVIWESFRLYKRNKLMLCYAVSSENEASKWNVQRTNVPWDIERAHAGLRPHKHVI